jgi:hypothetical protein
VPGEEVQPRAAVRAGELGRGAAGRESTGRHELAHGVHPLRGERGGLGTHDLLRHVGVVGQLGEPAAGAQPHPQREHRVRAWIVDLREQLRRRLRAEVEDDVPVGAVTGTAGRAGDHHRSPGSVRRSSGTAVGSARRPGMSPRHIEP